MFWDATPPDKHQFVADPSQGSRHNRGCAVDLSIYELATGREVPMTGGYDEMSERSYPTYTGGTTEQRGHRDLLRAAMEKQGFTVYETEWWHFDYKDWPHYAIQNVAFEQLQQREPLTIPLWPSGAPGAPANLAPEADTTTAKDNLIAGKPVIRLGNVSNPTLTVYTPTKNNTGDAVVVFPGGGYHILAMDLEGTEVCDWLTSHGITCALVKYRVPDSGPYPKSSAALQDAQRAVGIVRSHAADWHIDARKIGVLGFSAGAHLAAALSTHYDHRLYGTVDAADALSCRPDFAVIVYPGYLANAGNHFATNADIGVTDQTPPTFIVQAEDDPVHVENAVVYFLALKNAKVPAELHIYATGGHGYGLRPDSAHLVTQWPRQVEIWLHTIHMLPENP
jgi:acetyl esterase/lipase